MDPNVAVNTALTVLDAAINLIKHIRGQAALTDEQLSAQVDAQNLQNTADIKALLAL